MELANLLSSVTGQTVRAFTGGNGGAAAPEAATEGTAAS